MKKLVKSTVHRTIEKTNEVRQGSSGEEEEKNHEETEEFLNKTFKKLRLTGDKEEPHGSIGLVAHEANETLEVPEKRVSGAGRKLSGGGGGERS